MSHLLRSGLLYLGMLTSAIAADCSEISSGIRRCVDPVAGITLLRSTADPHKQPWLHFIVFGRFNSHPNLIKKGYELCRQLIAKERTLSPAADCDATIFYDAAVRFLEPPVDGSPYGELATVDPEISGIKEMGYPRSVCRALSGRICAPGRDRFACECSGFDGGGEVFPRY